VIDELIRAGRTPQQILRDMSRINRLELTPNSPAPLVILTTVYKAKVRFSRIFLGFSRIFFCVVGR